jgi:hypothetical protein
VRCDDQVGKSQLARGKIELGTQKSGEFLEHDVSPGGTYLRPARVRACAFTISVFVQGDGLIYMTDFIAGLYILDWERT